MPPLPPTAQRCVPLHSVSPLQIFKKASLKKELAQKKQEKEDKEESNAKELLKKAHITEPTQVMMQPGEKISIVVQLKTGPTLLGSIRSRQAPPY